VLLSSADLNITLPFTDRRQHLAIKYSIRTKHFYFISRAFTMVKSTIEINAKNQNKIGFSETKPIYKRQLQIVTQSYL